MKRIIFAVQTGLLFLALVSVPAAWADDDGYSDVPGMSIDSGNSLFTPEELDTLLAPIALYPDPLIAQILPAATFIDQIDEAARYITQYGKTARIDDQAWDVSVKAIAHYPDILFMMDQKYDWTVSVGQAFIDQQQDVMDAIQRLRTGAEAAGNLKSTPQQQVITEGGAIEIVPVDPEIIYVPQYDPGLIYAEAPYSSYSFIDFGIGFTIGVWLNRDCDWNRHRIHYHGWRGGGWIERSRSHIRVRNPVYVNNRFNTITIDHRVIQHDSSRYQENLRRTMPIRRERSTPAVPGGRDVKPPERIENRTAPQSRITPAARPSQQPVVLPGRPAIAAPAPVPVQHPDKRDVYRGREVKGGQTPAPGNGYGGYGSSRDAATFRERGQTSREQMRTFTRPAVSAPVRTPATASRPQSPGGSRPSAPPAAQHAPPAVRQAPAVGQQPPAAAVPGRRGEH